MVFCKIGPIRSYQTIPVNSDDIPKTALVIRFGNFKFFSMAFGPRNAKSTFKRLINEVVRGLEFVLTYVDYLLVAIDMEQYDVNHLSRLLERFRTYSVCIHTDKCVVVQKFIEFFGHLIDSGCIRPLPTKVDAIQRIISLRQLRNFLEW